MTEKDLEKEQAAGRPQDEPETAAPEDAAETVPETDEASAQEQPEEISPEEGVARFIQGYEEKIAGLTDSLKRQMAEFDNYRKRTEREKAAMLEVGARTVLEKMLPIVDSFERGLGGLSEEQKAEPFAAGMQQVYRQLIKALDELDVKPIEAKGQTFDPNLHNAVMHVEDEEAGENTVVEEFRKGYTYRGSVLRYSMVKVAN